MVAKLAPRNDRLVAQELNAVGGFGEESWLRDRLSERRSPIDVTGEGLSRVDKEPIKLLDFSTYFP